MAAVDTVSRSVRDHLLLGVRDEKPPPGAPPVDFPLYLIGQDDIAMPKPITNKRNGTTMTGWSQSGPTF